MPKVMVSPDQDSIVSEVEVAAPVERVFQALIDPQQLMQWFNNATCPVKFWKMDARAGGRYSYSTEETNLVINGINEFDCHGDILEIDPPRLLAYTWLGNWHEHPERPSMARWELSATKTGTRVKVTHSGLANEPIVRKNYAGGWPGVLEKLRNHCA